MGQGTRRFVDLSIYLENDVASDPPGLEPRIDYITHDSSVEQIAKYFPGLASADLPDGEGWAVERVRLSTHNGTHLDAPYHFHSTMDRALGERKPSTTIDDVPLEIVVVNTRAGSRYGHPDYVSAGCGMGYEATMYLLERGVRLTGTDAWSWDAPFVHTAGKYAETGDASLIWEGHKAGRDIGYCHLEKLHNLEALPGDGFIVSCFPHKIRGASAGWTRAVAIFDDALLAAGTP